MNHANNTLVFFIFHIIHNLEVLDGKATVLGVHLLLWRKIFQELHFTFMKSVMIDTQIALQKAILNTFQLWIKEIYFTHE